MIRQSKVTSKGQVTIPIEIREKFGINVDSKIMFIANNDTITIETVGDFRKYAGVLKESKVNHITNQEIKNIRTTGKLFVN